MLAESRVSIKQLEKSKQDLTDTGHKMEIESIQHKNQVMLYVVYNSVELYLMP